MLPSQQPPAHDVALQTQFPFTHCWVDAHVAQVVAPVPHEVLDWAE